MKIERIEQFTLAITAARSLLVFGAGVVSLMVLADLLSELTVAPLHAQTRPAVEFQAALTKEQVDGDLKTAVAAYQKIAADKSAPRDVRAKALLHLAGCYEKVGQQAQGVYQQIVRDFADQPAAAQARARLAAPIQQEHPAPPTTMTLRKIEWSSIGEMDDSDTDGQRAVYSDSSGSLFLGDLAGHSKRLVFKAQPDDAPGWRPSRDFSMSTLFFRDKPNRPAILAVTKTDGTGYHELIRGGGQETLGDLTLPCDWSWDNRYLLLVSRPRKGGGHLVVVSVADGHRRELVSTTTGYFAKAVFSPDGHHVAYEVAPLPDQSETSHVFVIPFQGGEPRQVYESAPKRDQGTLGFETWTLLDWTADGRYLAIADAPNGNTALYLIPVKNGAATGEPAFVRLGTFRGGYSTLSGSLVFSTANPGGEAQMFLASLDPDGHPGTWRPLAIRGGIRRNPWPSFTSDGRHIVYSVLNNAGDMSLVLYDLSTANERVLYRSDDKFFCQSAVLTPEVLCTEYKGGGKSDLFSVSAESGEVKRLETFEDRLGIRSSIAGSSHDGKIVYLLRIDLNDGNAPIPLFKWDLTRKEESPIFSPSDAGPKFVTVADDHWLIGSDAKNLFARSMVGGDWKPLASINQQSFPLALTPDEKWIIYKDTDPAGKQSLVRVSMGGGQPQRLGDFPVQKRLDGGLWLSPDGRQVLALSVDWNSSTHDLWVLDIFVPSTK